MMKAKLLLIPIMLIQICFLPNAQELIFNTQEFAPFSYSEKGVVLGPGADLIIAICQEAGIKPVLRSLPWARAQQEVKDGTAHALFLIGKNKEREETLYFSNALLITEYGFFVNTNNKKEFKTIADFKGILVGVYGPSNTATTLEKIKENEVREIKIEMTLADESGFKKLSLNRVDAVFSNKDVGNAIIKKLNLKNIKYVYAYNKIDYYIGFSRQKVDKKTLDKFNKAHAVLYKNNTIQKILDKYQMMAAPLE